MVIRILLLSLALSNAAAPLFAENLANRPGREASLPPSEVKDSFLAYVLGIIHAGSEVELDNQFLRSILSEFQTSIAFPFDDVRLVSQLRIPGTDRVSLAVVFRQEMIIPVPFSLLGYHPGSIRASARVVFTETRWKSRILDDRSVISPVYVFRLTEGYAATDLDEWITFLFSSIIDDISISVLAIFRYHERWYCMMDGTGRRGQVVAGLLDFRTNRIIFPLPRQMRGFAETLLSDEAAAGGPDRMSESAPTRAPSALSPSQRF